MVGTIRINNRDLKKTLLFEYLESMVTSNIGATYATRMRVNAAWFKWRQAIYCDKKMSLQSKNL